MSNLIVSAVLLRRTEDVSNGVDIGLRRMDTFVLISLPIQV